jgi:hypothetical protein
MAKRGIGAKQGDHLFLFDWVSKQEYQIYEHQTTDGKTHRYRHFNKRVLNSNQKRRFGIE